MDWALARSIAAAVAATWLVSGTWSQRLTAPLLAQQAVERMPGPLIEDPPGPYAGHSYVPAPTNGQAQPLSTFIVTYNGFTPQAQAAFEAALNVWASQISSAVPITVSANWVPLGSEVLGSAQANNLWRNSPGAPVPNTWFPDALANKAAGVDLDPAPDIIASFNSTFTWYYGTDGNAGTNYDLMTVILHEIGHGLGFFGSMTVGFRGSWGYGTGFPAMYDRFAINGASQVLIDTSIFPNPGLALSSQLVGNNLFFNGINTRNANGGNAARLYAPDVWRQGSSYSHLNEATFPTGTPNSLMTPQLGAGEAIHDPGAITRGIFIDQGWAVSAPCSYALSPNSITLPGVAGTGSVNVVTTSGCAWTATSNAGFASITGGSSGTGNGTVTFSVMANSGNARSGTLTIAGQTFTILQAGGSFGDFDSDGRSEVTVFRPSTGQWFVLRSSTNFTGGAIYQWGGSGDIPVLADYDGDGRPDIAIYRPSTGQWFVLRSSTTYTGGAVYQWGGDASDIPVPGDYDGDGRPDIAIYRKSTGQWYVLRSSTSYTGGALYLWGGDASDSPVVGDYDGDGRADMAVYRRSTGQWFVLRSSTNYTGGALYTWGGSAGDVPVPGNYDGDAITDIAVYRPAQGNWYILRSSTNFTGGALYQWGESTDRPVPADYDGDGKTDIAIFRPAQGNWYVLRSSTNFTGGAVYQWGGATDIPAVNQIAAQCASVPSSCGP